MNSLVAPLQPSIPASAEAGSSWEALLHLECAKTERGTRVLRKQQRGPLYLQRPFYPEGPELAHLYLLHPPGGLVSGDTLTTSLLLQDGAQVLATTPGAARLYRARSDRRCQRQLNLLQAGTGCSLEWLPQENIVFNDAHAELTTRVELAPTARFFGWDITVLGLPATGIRFTEGALRQCFEVRQSRRLVLREHWQLDDSNRALAEAAIGLRGQPVTGIAIGGPFSPAQLEVLPHDALREIRADAMRPALCGYSLLGDWLVARYLGSSAEQARRLFTAYWSLLRPQLLARPASAPEIWAT